MLAQWRQWALATLPHVGATAEELDAVRKLQTLGGFARATTEDADSVGKVWQTPSMPGTVLDILVQKGVLPNLLATDSAMSMMREVAKGSGDIPNAGEIPNAEERITFSGGVFFRLMYELDNLMLLRTVDATISTRRLESETPLLVAYVLGRCREQPACLHDYYPTVRASKGLLAIALGSTLPISADALIAVTPAEEQKLVSEMRASLARIDNGGSAVGNNPVAKLLGPAATERILKETNDLRDPDPDLRYLDADAAFIDYYRFPVTDSHGNVSQHYGAFVSIGHQPARFVTLGLRGDIETIVETWRRTAKTPSDTAWHGLTRQLRDAVWTPIETMLPATVKRIIIAPDANLYRVSWSALVADTGAAVHAVHAVQATPERMVSVVQSWHHYTYLHNAPRAPQSRRALIVRDIVFGAETQFEPVTAAPEIEPGMRTAGLTVSVLSGDAVTKERVAAASIDAKIMHVLTHGSSVAVSATGFTALDALRSTSLALSGTNQLSAADMVKWNLSHVQLVVLAACNSGYGSTLDGQGALDFQLAASAAGARSALVSLWPAPDGEATKLFLETFYSALLHDGTTVAAALARAQQRLKSTPDFAHPAYWAGWSAVGETWKGVK
jgi:CHAT domain-containing protein